ncbi:hypothetical protein DPMN_053651 [Dreissena polymorpha]|uniref:Uncharacterized protein n=1 Tax=Dreissena polymorpha TaxID=45954 RepID=A0A9D4HSE5_DREPO|nr:hypothetical protein DPMN_053651 [Dreissena polymorpha]
MGLTVKLFEVNEEKMEEIEKQIPEKIKLVKNNMKIHQVTTTEQLKISARILSCSRCVDLKATHLEMKYTLINTYGCNLCYIPEDTCFTDHADEIAVNTEVSVGGPCPENSTEYVPSEKVI